MSKLELWGLATKSISVTLLKAIRKSIDELLVPKPLSTDIAEIDLMITKLP